MADDRNDEWLARRFEDHRAHMRAVALRVLGSGAEADDAVQEAWIRLSRSDVDAVENLGGWLTTVVSRVALDMLRSRGARRADPMGEPASEEARPDDGDDPAEQAGLSDAVGPALLLVLDTLTPPERLAFVLHDTFGVPFDEIGPILERSPNAAKQMASRARRKVRGAGQEAPNDPARQRAVVDAFLAAARAGDFAALLTLLDPDVEVRADATAMQMGSPELTQGATAVARTFSGRALGAQPALLDGDVGMVWAVGGRPKVAWVLTIAGGVITSMEMVADRAELEGTDVVVLDPVD